MEMRPTRKERVERDHETIRSKKGQRDLLDPRCMVQWVRAGR